MSPRPEELYIFVTSPRPDPYINILVHATRNFPLKQIHFICIAEHGYEDEGEECRAATIAASVQAMLDELAEGKYRTKSDVMKLTDDYVTEYREALGRLKFVRLSSMGIRWSELTERLRDFTKNGKAVFDVTALKKNLLVDVVVTLLSFGESDVRTFGIHKKPTYGPDDLIHALRDGRDYTYYCLADSRHVEAAKRRMVSKTLTFYTLSAATLFILVPVFVVQFLFPKSWVQGVFAALATAVSIVSWGFCLHHRR